MQQLPVTLPVRLAKCFRDFKTISFHDPYRIMLLYRLTQPGRMGKGRKAVPISHNWVGTTKLQTDSNLRRQPTALIDGPFGVQFRRDIGAADQVSAHASRL